jgi:hypothetical protein
VRDLLTIGVKTNHVFGLRCSWPEVVDIMLNLPSTDKILATRTIRTVTQQRLQFVSIAS